MAASFDCRPSGKECHYKYCKEFAFASPRTVDGVSTLDPGNPANVSVNVVGNTLHFTFDLPRGNDRAQGPPFVQAVIDIVNTLNPG